MTMDFAEALDAHETKDQEREVRAEARTVRLERRMDGLASTLQHLEVGNTSTAEAMKRAVTEAMSERDAAKVAMQVEAGSRRAWLVAAYIGTIAVVACVLALVKVVPEAIVLILGTIIAAGWKAIDTMAPSTPKTPGGTSIRPPPTNGGIQ